MKSHGGVFYSRLRQANSGRTQRDGNINTVETHGILVFLPVTPCQCDTRVEFCLDGLNFSRMRPSCCVEMSAARQRNRNRARQGNRARGPTAN